mmetsp:Transcript_3601/g.9055  ORF Transcript_3601/g.9055 Transcript_3601/m.9055 type:complete len:224 (-) Transcript_3601:688-1359(-)
MENHLLPRISSPGFRKRVPLRQPRRKFGGVADELSAMRVVSRVVEEQARFSESVDFGNRCLVHLESPVDRNWCHIALLGEVLDEVGVPVEEAVDWQQPHGQRRFVAGGQLCLLIDRASVVRAQQNVVDGLHRDVHFSLRPNQPVLDKRDVRNDRSNEHDSHIERRGVLNFKLRDVLKLHAARTPRAELHIARDELICSRPLVDKRHRVGHKHDVDIGEEHADA